MSFKGKWTNLVLELENTNVGCVASAFLIYIVNYNLSRSRIMTLLNQDYKCTRLSTRNIYPLEKLKTYSNHNYNINVVSVTACWQKIPKGTCSHVRLRYIRSI